MDSLCKILVVLTALISVSVQDHPKRWRQFRLAHDFSRSQPRNRTCPELNVTFTNDPPFDVLGVPECGDQVKPKMVLYLPYTDVSCELSASFLPNNETRACLDALDSRKSIKKVVVVTHGFLKSFSTPWLHQMQKDIQIVDPNTAVIVVGWGHGLRDIFSYWRAASNSRYIGYVMYLILREIRLRRTFYIHCAGHSLGAHGCAFAGKLLVKERKSFILDRISGMDPAGPLFANDVPYPFDYMNISSSSRLSRSDAIVVDVIHTDGDARYLGILPQYGTMEAIGTVDFYPGRNGNYGHDQPGCLDFINIVSCSHSRAHDLYLSSIRQEVCLASQTCPRAQGDKPPNIPKDCQPLPEGEVVAMGYWWDSVNPIPGEFTVDVVSYAPYCNSNTFKHQGQLNNQV